MIRKGDRVEKTSGNYKFPGIVVAKYRTHFTREWRFVVECTAFECLGMQHIFNETNLTRVIDGELRNLEKTGLGLEHRGGEVQLHGRARSKKPGHHPGRNKTRARKTKP